MSSVLSGFLTVWVVIAVGWVLGRVGMLDDAKQLVLNNLSFHVLSPCLLFLLMARVDLRNAFAANMAVNFLATCIAAVAYLAIALPVFKLGARAAVIGAWLASYVNAANLGLPIAAYVLHDMSWIAPVLLFQTALLQPAGVTILDVLEGRRGERRPWWRQATVPFRNPLTAGTLLGLIVNLAHIRLPDLLAQPINLIGQSSVPIMLIAFGVSLQVNGLPGIGRETPKVWTATAIKLLVHPLVAFLLARYLFHLTPPTVLACTVIGGLPSAQNVFVIAQRYRAGVDMARDTTFLNTLLSIPTLLVITLLAHALAL